MGKLNETNGREGLMMPMEGKG